MAGDSTKTPQPNTNTNTADTSISKTNQKLTLSKRMPVVNDVASFIVASATALACGFLTYQFFKQETGNNHAAILPGIAAGVLTEGTFYLMNRAFMLDTAEAVFNKNHDPFHIGQGLAASLPYAAIIFSACTPFLGRSLSALAAILALGVHTMFRLKETSGPNYSWKPAIDRYSLLTMLVVSPTLMPSYANLCFQTAPEPTNNLPWFLLCCAGSAALSLPTTREYSNALRGYSNTEQAYRGTPSQKALCTIAAIAATTYLSITAWDISPALGVAMAALGSRVVASYLLYLSNPKAPTLKVDDEPSATSSLIHGKKS